MRNVFVAIFVIGFANVLSQDIVVHDPVMIKAGSQYYLFCTGEGITVFSSPDMKTWTRQKAVFDNPPAWALKTVSGFKGHIWAPDISYHAGKYYLYYSVSAFAKNTSCIGLATNTTLNPRDKNYQWIDHGKVIQSVPGRDMWNAIDPNLAFDDQQNPWLVFGSFWEGIKLVKLSGSLTEIAQPEEWHTVSKRTRSVNFHDEDPGDAAVEAPFIFHMNGFYYLFVSFDFCCRGVKSNYNIVVGRSEKIEGPYLDRDGLSMNDGGGTVVLKGTESWPGLGHNSVYNFNGEDFLVFHAYDASDNGKPKLKIKPIDWDGQGWPIVSMD
jgi:arabinan endo-1,5-alpha-L-arabinosidase